MENKKKKFSKPHDFIDDISDMEDNDDKNSDFDINFDNMLAQRGTQEGDF